jgi:thiol-disulfide isomerase/thioredoxin
MKKLLILLVAVVAAGAGFLAARYWGGPHEAAPEQAATPEPESMVAFELPDLDGKTHNILEWHGKVVVLNFWATWCPPCREEIPMFIELQQQYGSQGLQFIGVAIDQADAVRDYRDSMLIDYPILLGEREALGIMTQYGNRAGVLPYSVVIDRSGRIRETRPGAYTRAELEPVLKPLLQAQP